MKPSIATYRLQLRAEFTMFDAAAVVNYLADLGVSHLYLSPILQSKPGSAHGYDGADPTRIDRDRGGDEGLTALRAACAQRGLQLVLDIVPNHLDISCAANTWWRSVLESGAESPWANAFDIDWDEEEDAPEPVLAPVLGDRVQTALRRREVQLERDGADFAVRYYEHRFPLSPESVTDVVESACKARGPANAAVALDLNDVLNDAELARAIDSELERIADSPASMRELLSKQHYRLASWRRAGSELNYRRFFDVNTLVGVRVEREDVFQETHRLIAELARSSDVAGLRVDHPDGLRDPRGYFTRLAAAAPDAWLIAEKILEPGEDLRADWPIAGTTGYDFLNHALRLLVDARAERRFTELHSAFTGCDDRCEELVFEAKWHAAMTLLHADLRRLTRFAQQVATNHDLPGSDEQVVAEALALLAACMPVYRTYIVPESGEIAAEDVEVIARAHEEACRRRPDLAPALDWLRDVLLLKIRPTLSASAAAPEDELVARFQQYSAPVMAKGVEDTAFYRYTRFIALNEVGGDPIEFSVTPQSFHAFNDHRSQRWPRTMNTTATHDTKRGEDVRARLAALSEIPDEWAAAVGRWSTMLAALAPPDDVQISRNTEYLFYQTAIGAWPIDGDRLSAYMLKAAREAKQESSWLEPNESYEAALQEWVTRVLAHEPFTREVEALLRMITPAARIKSLAQTLLKLTCPGVPDIYQGCEWWDFSLVDPDNRRPVDYGRRQSALEQWSAAAPADVWATLADPDDPGIAKQWMIARALQIRRNHQSAFDAEAKYVPLHSRGANDRLLAFARTSEDERDLVVVVTPRMLTSAESWGDAALPLPADRTWCNVLTDAPFKGHDINVRTLLAAAPVALLVATEP